MVSFGYFFYLEEFFCLFALGGSVDMEDHSGIEWPMGVVGAAAWKLQHARKLSHPLALSVPYSIDVKQWGPQTQK